MKIDDRHIVFYIGGFPPIGGIQSFIRDLMVELAPIFPSQELVYWGQRPDELPMVQEIASSGGRITRSPLRLGCRWNWPDYFLRWQASACVQRADVLVFKQLPPLRILYDLHCKAAGQKRRIPFVWITPYRPAEYWTNISNYSFLNLFDAIAVQSAAGITDLQGFGYTGKIFNLPYLPPPVKPLSDFPPANGSHPITIGFLGRFETQKNVRYLLECYKRLTELDAQETYRLRLFGDGSEKDALIAHADSLGLSSCEFCGPVGRDGVNSAIDSCHFFLNTSLTEGQCLVALEVLSRGRPFVATPVGALPEVIFDPSLGRLIPLGDVEAAARELLKCASEFRNRQITPQIVYHTFGKKFDRHTVADGYTAMLRSIMSN